MALSNTFFTGVFPTATIRLFVICVVCTLLHLEELLSYKKKFCFRFFYWLNCSSPPLVFVVINCVTENWKNEVTEFSGLSFDPLEMEIIWDLWPAFNSCIFVRKCQM